MWYVSVFGQVLYSEQAAETRNVRGDLRLVVFEEGLCTLRLIKAQILLIAVQTFIQQTQICNTFPFLRITLTRALACIWLVKASTQRLNVMPCLPWDQAMDVR